MLKGFVQALLRVGRIDANDLAPTGICCRSSTGLSPINMSAPAFHSKPGARLRH